MAHASVSFVKSTGERYVMPQRLKEIPSLHAGCFFPRGGLLNVSLWWKNEESNTLF